MPVTLECGNPTCDKTFTVPPSHAEDRSHCSRECHQEVRARKARVEVKCDRDGCNEIIQDNRGNLEWRKREYDGVYCSDECSSLASRKGEILICANCGKKFHEPQWKLDCDDYLNKYCGAECRYGKELRNGEWKEGTCEYCGACFEYFTLSSKGRYCGLSCYQKSLRPSKIEEKPTKDCIRCGEAFPVPPSKVDEYKFCSKDCRKGIVRLFGEPVMKQCQQCHVVKAVESFPEQYDKKRESVYTLNTCTECRRASRRHRYGLSGTFTASDIHQQWHRQAGECFWCGTRCGKNPVSGEYHVDHLTPVAKSAANPTNYPRNLVISCPSCNYAKSDKLPIEFKRYRLQNGKERTYYHGTRLPSYDDGATS